MTGRLRWLGVLAAMAPAAGGAVFTRAPEIAANPNASVPLAAVVRFAADAPVRTALRISDGQRKWELSYGESRKPEDGLPVLGMRPGRKHEIRVSIKDASGRETAAPKALEFTTPPLPADAAEFPKYKITASRPERMEAGFTVLSVRRQRRGPEDEFGRAYGLLLGLDAQGEVVWHYRGPRRISDFERLRNGRIVYLTEDNRAVEIDMLGNVTAEWRAVRRPQGPGEGIAVDAQTFHHHIIEMPSGNLAVLSTEQRELDNYITSETDPKAPRKRQKVMGDEIVEFQRDGKVVWRWNAFDHLDPYRVGYLTVNQYWVIRGFPDALDWTHGNGLFYDRRDDTMLLNLRQQSAALKIERPSGKIRWIFAEPVGWGKLESLVLKPEGKITYPWHQHAANITPAGTLLLFDNGILRARPFDPQAPREKTFSRAAEYAVEGTKTREVWASEETGPEAVVSFAMGDADWMPKTGNILICYGDASKLSNPQQSWPRVREVTHAKTPEVVFEVVLPADPAAPGVRWAIFGSERFPNF